MCVRERESVCVYARARVCVHVTIMVYLISNVCPSNASVVVSAIYFRMKFILARISRACFLFYVLILYFFIFI